MLYRLHTLDILDGEINDEYTTSDILTLPDDPTADDVAKALIGLERMAEDWPRDDVKLDDSEGPETLYVTHKDGTKVYKLVQEEDEDDDTPPDCPKCGQPMTDTYCHTGKARCDECDPECPGCSDGPGPMAAYRDTEQDDEAEDDDAPHEHQWGPVETARFTGNPHRKCQVPGCNEITLDIGDEDDLFPDLTEEDERQEELSADAERRAMNRLWDRLEGD